VTDSSADRLEDSPAQARDKLAPLGDLKVLDLSQAVSGPFCRPILG